MRILLLIFCLATSAAWALHCNLVYADLLNTGRYRIKLEEVTTAIEQAEKVLGKLEKPGDVNIAVHVFGIVKDGYDSQTNHISLHPETTFTGTVPVVVQHEYGHQVFWLNLQKHPSERIQKMVKILAEHRRLQRKKDLLFEQNKDTREVDSEMESLLAQNPGPYMAEAACEELFADLLPVVTSGDPLKIVKTMDARSESPKDSKWRSFVKPSDSANWVDQALASGPYSYLAPVRWHIGEKYLGKVPAEKIVEAVYQATTEALERDLVERQSAQFYAPSAQRFNDRVIKILDQKLGPILKR